ncbi:MAG: hypothetical protein ABR564_01965 [Candidatus Dormibacteria bacterium]
MDPLGILLATAALAIYPGGLFLCAAAAIAAWAGRLPPAGAPWTAPEALGCTLSLVAVSLVPLAASPAQVLPPGSGAAGNAAVVLTLMAAAVALVTPAPWRPAQIISGVGCLVAALALAAATSTLALPTVVAIPGDAVAAARMLAGGALLMAAPLLVPPGDRGVARPARAVVGASLTVLALSLFVPAALSGRPPWLTAPVILVSVGLHFGLQHRLRALWAGGRIAAAGLSITLAASAVVLALLSGA